MTTKKLLIALVTIAVIGSVVAYGIFVRNRGVVAVQTGRVLRQDLTQLVAANGEIKPKKYVNISSNMMGRIVNMPVREGDHVKEETLLMRLESVQTESDVRAAEAGLDAAFAELEGMDASIRSAEAAVTSARADVMRAEADQSQAQQNFVRSEGMSKDGLISREQFERAKADVDIANAQLNAAKARLAQTEAQSAQVIKQKDSVGLRINQQKAALTRARDQLGKTIIRSPLEGIITSLPVHEGEIAIVGVQNQPGTTLMTIADMSVITAEVQVDETDIVNVKLGQEAQVKVDALADRSLTGRVSEIGNSPIIRTSGPINTTTSSQEAKDFKVVITLDNPPPELRPGLSCTASIVTATRPAALTVPIQAITVREVDPLMNSELSSDDSGIGVPPSNSRSKKVEQEGVFVIQNGNAVFRRVKTGIVGTTEIEILEGLTANEDIVTGSFQVLRTLQHNTRIKVEKQP